MTLASAFKAGDLNTHRLHCLVRPEPDIDEPSLSAIHQHQSRASSDLVGSFEIPLAPEDYETIENPDDFDLITRFAEFDGRASIHLFLHVRSTVLSADDAERFGFRIDPRLFDDPDEHLEALWATSGISWDLSGHGDGYAKIRISRRYADGAIDAMLAVWDAAQTNLDEILGDPIENRRGCPMNTTPTATMPTADDRGRALLVIDLENAFGCDPDHVPDWAWSIAIGDVLAAAGAAPGDQVVVAVSPRRAFQARAALPGALLRCRRGVDGADLALIDELADIDWIADRFERIVIASGDHIFADHAARIAAAGVRVDHVAHRGRCSASLRLAVHRTCWLPNHHWASGSDAA